MRGRGSSADILGVCGGSAPEPGCPPQRDRGSVRRGPSQQQGFPFLSKEDVRWERWGVCVCVSSRSGSLLYLLPGRGARQGKPRCSKSGLRLRYFKGLFSPRFKRNPRFRPLHRTAVHTQTDQTHPGLWDCGLSGHLSRTLGTALEALACREPVTPTPYNTALGVRLTC